VFSGGAGDYRAGVTLGYLQDKGFKVPDDLKDVFQKDLGEKEISLTLSRNEEDGPRSAKCKVAGTELPYRLQVDEKGHIDGEKLMKYLVSRHGLDLRPIRVGESRVSPWSQLIQMLVLGFTEASLVEPDPGEEPGTIFVTSTPLGIVWRAEMSGVTIPVDGLRPWRTPPPRQNA